MLHAALVIRKSNIFLCHSFENDEGIFNFICNITIKGQYKARGNLLILKIDGEGDAKIGASKYVFFYLSIIMAA